jgi:hypothetical protein
MFVLCILSAIAGLIYFIAAVASAADPRARVLQKGLDGRGIVLAASKTATNSILGGVRYESRWVKLDVEVPGRPPYEVSLTPLIPRICEVLPGSSLDLKVDPADPKNITVVGPVGSIGWMAAAPLLFPRAGARAAGPNPIFTLAFLPFIALFGVLGVVLSPSEHKASARSAVAPASHETCEAAARCCAKLGMPAAACKSYKSMSEAACKNVLDSERKSAARQKKVCE